MLSIANMSITASIMIVAIIMLRLCLKKAPKILTYCLWGIVLFRLLCPVSFEANFSPLAFAPTTSQHTMEYVTPTTIVAPVAVAYQSETAIPEPPQAHTIPWLTILWVAGMVSIATYGLFSYLRLRKRLVGSLLLEPGVYLSDYIDGPFVLGLLKPKIYLPSGITVAERNYILAHEHHHIHRADHITRCLAFLALTLHWFNPLVWLAFYLSAKDMELSCDEAVMAKMERDIRADYATSLLRFATAKPALTAIGFGESETKTRIKNVLSYKKPSFWVIITGILAVVALSVFLLANPKPEVENRETTPSLTASASYQPVLDLLSAKIGNPDSYHAEDNKTVYVDINSDGTEELLLGYLDKQRLYYRWELWTLEDEKPILVREQNLIAMAGSPSGAISLVDYNGTTYLAVADLSAGDRVEGGSQIHPLIYLYTMEGATLCQNPLYFSGTYVDRGTRWVMNHLEGGLEFDNSGWAFYSNDTPISQEDFFSLTKTIADNALLHAGVWLEDAWISEVISLYDNIQLFDEAALQRIFQSYYVSTVETFQEGQEIPFDKAFSYGYHGGFYTLDGTVRPELLSHFDEATWSATVDAELMDQYLLSKFPTTVDHSKISAYEDGTYTITGFQGGIPQTFAVTDILLDGNTISFTGTATMEGVVETYHISLEITNGEYRFLV